MSTDQQTTYAAGGPLVADDRERQALGELDRLLCKASAAQAAGALKLEGANGEAVMIPDSALQALCQVVHHLASGRAVTLVPAGRELTTQEAADILNVSRPHLIKLLEQGDIPFVRTGTHRRIQLSDLMAYKRQRDTQRHEALSRLTQMSQELGLYREPLPSRNS
jgi:excisionase family DNA binding protein